MATAAAAKGKELTFVWEGRDKAGKTVRGEMRATGQNMVEASLRRQGITGAKVKKQRRSMGGSVQEKDVALFTRQMATMMKAGVPLLQAFDIVGKGATNPAVARLLSDIKTEVETGSSLAQAFRKYPLHFDALYCNLVAAGEAAGILESLLDRLAIYKEKTLAIKSKIKSALFYPVSIIVVAIVITAVIMIFVIPAFKSVFSSFGADLPTPTLVVMAISDWTVANWYILFPALGGAIYGFLEAWKRSLAVQIFMDRLSLKLPIFGSLLRKAAIAKWTRTLSTMFAAGVPLVEALDSVGGAAGNDVYLKATQQIKSEVATGTGLTVAMQNANVFPSMVLQMCQIGEETGALDAMLGKVADFFEAEVDEAVEALSSLMEPIIMVVLGTLIGGMVVAMYLPIFKLGGAV
ncbi:MAG TPA: type II secretion system F family protein [Burkholderiales bacterium]|nr:type II secretion system F family protein [Burkholderiales bacterium]